MPRVLAAFVLLIAAPLVSSDVDVPVATILAYHEVDSADAPPHATIPRLTATGDPASERLRYTATTENFKNQLDFLQQNGYHVIPLEELVDYLKGNRDSLPPKAVVITVDDGWLCAYTEILPELQRRRMPFTLFVYPEIVGRGSHAVAWPQVKEMSRDGVDVESHTFTHAFLTLRENDMRFLEHELLDSKQVIEKKTRRPVRFLSYPFGDYDAVVVEAAARYGYEAAVTTVRGPITRATALMALKRYLIHHDTTLVEFKTFLLP